MYNPIMSAALLKFRVVASQVATQPMRFEPVFGPHPRNPHMRDVTEFFGQFSLAPVRRTVGGLFLNRPFKNARLLAFAIRTRQTSHMARTQSRQTISQKPTLPARNEIGVAVQFTANQIKSLARIDQQDQSRSSRLCCTIHLTSNPAMQLFSFRLRQLNRFHQRFRRFSCVTIH